MSELSPAAKATKVQRALKTLGGEYHNRPDVVHAIREFIDMAGPSTLARLHDLVVDHETPQSALESIGLDPR
jgi:hypothetical protein